MDEEKAKADGLLVVLDSTVDDAYVAMVKSRILRPALIKEAAANVKIVYTPFTARAPCSSSGSWANWVFPFSPFPSSGSPTGLSPRCPFPTRGARRPEDGYRSGHEAQADVVMATDPDADRLGIAVPTKDGSFTLVTGNQLGSLQLDYILLSLTELKRMPPKPVCIKSIVTTDFQAAIAAKYEV